MANHMTIANAVELPQSCVKPSRCYSAYKNDDHDDGNLELGIDIFKNKNISYLMTT